MIADFGVATFHDRFTQSFPDAGFSSATDPTMGTIRWMSPELLCGTATRRTRESDMWALACTILEARLLLGASYIR